MMTTLVALSGLAILGGFISYLYHSLDEYIIIESQRVITKEDEDNMDYVELNGELVPYNEEDQE